MSLLPAPRTSKESLVLLQPFRTGGDRGTSPAQRELEGVSSRMRVKVTRTITTEKGFGPYDFSSFPSFLSYSTTSAVKLEMPCFELSTCELQFSPEPVAKNYKS